ARRDRPGGDGVDPDMLVAELDRHIFDRGFERRLDARSSTRPLIWRENCCEGARGRSALGGLSLDVAQRRSKPLAKRALHCAVASERLAAGPPRRWDGASLRLGGQPPYNLISGRRFGRSIILRAQVARPGMDRTNLSLGVLD